MVDYAAPKFQTKPIGRMFVRLIHPTFIRLTALNSLIQLIEDVPWVFPACYTELTGVMLFHY
jgi:hypothetical protein